MGDFCGNYSVKAKLTFVMSAVLLVAAALGLFAVWELRSVNARAAEIRNDWLPSTRVLGELNYAVTRVRSSESSSLQFPAGAALEQQATRSKALEKAVDDALAVYAPLISSDEERAIADRIQKGWAAYRPLYDEALAKARAGDREGATAYFIGPMRASFDALNKAVGEGVALNNAGGIAAADRGAATYESAEIGIFAALILAAGVCAYSIYALNACIARPLSGVTGAMREMASGNLGQKIPYADRSDEIGQLAGVMRAFKDQLAAAERAKAEQTEIIVNSVGTGLDTLAQGDLTHRISAELTGPFAKLKTDFNAAILRLEETMKKILASIGQIANGAGEISQAADDLSRRTEQQAASLEETAAALEEIAGTMKRTAENSREADLASEVSANVAKEGGLVLDSATNAMDAIAQSSREIAEIIGVIDEIAFQTNLLALNAGVEAARAGDAGRGFAVVASEVRALAGRSSEAAKKIKTLINTSGSHVTSGVKLVDESSQALKRIVEQGERINALVSEMAGAAEQQSTGIQQVNAAVSQMDQVTQQNAAMVEQSTAASRNLAEETRVLVDLVGYFQVSGGAAVRSVAVKLPAAKPAARPAKKIAAAGASGDWTEF